MSGRRIVLVGSMGAGKTTIGRALAVRLGWRYWDNDAELRRVAGREAADVLATDGADRLHALEADVFAEALAAPPPLVVSAPGSVALDPALPERLDGAYVVWLRARPDTLAARVAAGPERPFVTADPAAVAELDAVRRPVFAAVATLAVDVDDAPVEEIVERIVASR